MRMYLYLVFAVLIGIPHVQAQTAQETGFAKAVLSQLQSKSIREDREYCGYIARRDDGTLIATTARRGQLDHCTPRLPREDVELVASFHTHGAYDYDADSELPSPEDLEADIFEQVDGWVSTPGGRLWFNDHETATTRQICGIGCLPSDPAFERGVAGRIENRYTLRGLYDRIRRLDG